MAYKCSSSALILLVTSALVAIACAPFVWMADSWGEATTKGIMADQATWPEPIRDLHTAMRRADIGVASIEVYLADGRRGDTDSTVICRLPDSEQTWDFLKRQLELKPLPGDLEKEIAIDENVPPEWWAADDGDVQYLASRRALEGDEGDLYLVVRDPTARRIFIHYHYNF